VRIERFDPSADQSKLRACYEIMVGGLSEDDPNRPPTSFAGFRGWWIHGMAGVPQQTWLATTGSSTPLGCYVIELPELENRGSAFCYPFVAVGSRRRGVGTALVAHAAEQAEMDGRTLLMSHSRVGAPGAAFAAAIGARPGLRDARRVLDIGPGLRARLPGLRAETAAHAAGYTLRRWSGPVPDIIGQVCTLLGAMADAPHEESFEPPSWDPARVRAAEARAITQGGRWHQVAAIHDDSGEVAALTQIEIDPEVDGWAFQDITAVIRPHRGHRLGLGVKVAMLEWIGELEPQVRHIVTFNAVQNEHMVAVNAELGHRVTDYFESFELDVGVARKLGATR